MHRVVFILPNEENRLPKAETLKQAGFLVSEAMGRDAVEDGGREPLEKGPESPEENKGRTS